jgi:hypothetical protein
MPTALRGHGCIRVSACLCPRKAVGMAPSRDRRVLRSYYLPLTTHHSPLTSYFFIFALNSAMYFSGLSLKASAQPEQQT